MKKTIIGNRTGKSSYLNLYMKTRMGDLAGCRALMCSWRRQHPERRLYIFYNPFDPLAEYSRNIPIEWVFQGVADEVWIQDSPHEPIFLPGDETYDIFHGHKKNYMHLWAGWREHMKHPDPDTPIMPPQRILERGEQIKKEYEIPERFVVIQALFEAGYHQYRNAPKAWWSAVAEAVAQLGIPVALIGPTKYMQDVRVPGGVYPVFRTLPNPFEAMGLIAKASVFVGGETGLPLWAGVFKVPVVATFRGWQLKNENSKDCKNLEYRPISFGAPVVYTPLEGSVVQAAQTIKGVFTGSITTSTPTGYNP